MHFFHPAANGGSPAEILGGIGVLPRLGGAAGIDRRGGLQRGVRIGKRKAERPRGVRRVPGGALPEIGIDGRGLRKALEAGVFSGCQALSPSVCCLCAAACFLRLS